MWATIRPTTPEGFLLTPHIGDNQLPYRAHDTAYEVPASEGE